MLKDINYNMKMFALIYIKVKHIEKKVGVVD